MLPLHTCLDTTGREVSPSQGTQQKIGETAVNYQLKALNVESASADGTIATVRKPTLEYSLFTCASLSCLVVVGLNIPASVAPTAGEIVMARQT